jgi:hypothetical protein
MGRIPYNEEFSGGTGGPKFPTVKLVKDERKRIVCPEAPWMEWVHRIEAPEFQNGQPLLKKKEGRNGEPDTMVWSLEWMGNPICSGAHEVLRANGGLDPQNCIVCRVSQQMNGKGVLPAMPRYAMNVLEYAMLPNGVMVEPFNLRPVIWAFTGKMYDKLLQLKTEHKLDNLQTRDLILGPVEGPLHFQRYSIELGANALWMEHPNGAAVIRQVYTPANLANEDQLQAACGRKPSQYLTQDLERAQQRWSMAEAAQAQAQAQAQGMGASQQFGGQLPQQGLQQGFDNVLAGAAPGGAQPQYAPPQPAQSPFGGGIPAQSANGQVPQPAAAQPAGNPFGQQAPQPQSPPQAGNPFGQQPAAQPAGNPFAQQQPAPQPAAAAQGNPFSSVQPVQQPAGDGAQLPPGLAVFQPMTQGGQPAAQPSLEAPAPAAPQPGQSVGFGDLMNMGGQPPAQPGQ